MNDVINNHKSNLEKQFAIDSNLKKEEIFSTLQNPKLDENISIQIPIEWWHKKKNISSCGFWVLANRIQVLNMTMDEDTIKKEFLKQSNPVSGTFKKLWRNTFWTTPKSLISWLDRMLKDKNQPYEAEMKSWLSLEDIIKVLESGQPIMVMYNRQQTYLFDMLKQKSKHIEKTFKGKEHYFSYGYPHYALLVGLDWTKQIAKLLDPNTWKIEEIPFKLWREQFELQSHHSGPIFTFAKKIWIMKPKTWIYLKKIEGK